MTAITPPVRVPQRMHRMRWTRNGSSPTAYLMNALSNQLNHVLAYRRKELFRYHGNMLVVVSAGAGGRERWNFRCNTGTHCRQLAIQMVLTLADNTFSPVNDPYGKCTVTTAGGGTLGSVQVNYGNNGGFTPTGTPNELYSGTRYLNCVANTAYEIAFADFNDARLQGCVVYEISAYHDTDFGFVEAGYSMQGPIYDAHRASINQKLTEAWRFNAAHIFNWTADVITTPKARSSATAANLLDLTTTTFTAATPAWQVDLTYKNSISQPTIKCVFAAQATMSGSTGLIELVRVSDGVTVASLSPNSVTRQWYTTTCDIDPTVERYCVMIAGAGIATLSVFAVSFYEYQA